MSQVSGEGIEGATVLILAQGSRGPSWFSSTYEISRKTAITDENGYFDVALRYEDSNNFFTILQYR